MKQDKIKLIDKLTNLEAELELTEDKKVIQKIKRAIKKVETKLKED